MINVFLSVQLGKWLEVNNKKYPSQVRTMIVVQLISNESH